jgi:hypothetical protein
MRVFRAIPLLLLGLALPAGGSSHTSPPVQPATTFAAVEVHEDEKVAIAVEPYDTREKGTIFRVDFIGHGVMPIRLIVTNNGDRPINLREARILFITAAGDRIAKALSSRCPARYPASSSSPQPALEKSSRTLTPSSSML